ncbi:hypothetical protein [Persicitalea jodogahamensis]|uniref:Uncharacterized protein n=1 Tax=Persicitalea jodogahamensis TaxID=402147 RepID=A0A8J3DBF8_9BACT|nr:hypothetical protein [Persicitalea jodogahamensis]GHB72491.1 hypothetical protein GCM10007390_28190 [Persicitalea jodogahamensis]
MKSPAVILLVLFSGLYFGFTAEKIKVTPDFTDEQITKAEQDALKSFSQKVEIKVLKRNGNGEIVHLKCIYYDTPGKFSASCESDSFGCLLIKKSGCTIADKPCPDNIDEL